MVVRDRAVGKCLVVDGFGLVVTEITDRRVRLRVYDHAGLKDDVWLAQFEQYKELRPYITIVPTRIKGQRVRLGVEAPREVQVTLEEKLPEQLRSSHCGCHGEQRP